MTPFSITVVNHYHHYSQTLVSCDDVPGTVLRVLQTLFWWIPITLWGHVAETGSCIQHSFSVSPLMDDHNFVHPSPVHYMTKTGLWIFSHLSSQSWWVQMLHWNLFRYEHYIEFWNIRVNLLRGFGERSSCSRRTYTRTEGAFVL